MEQIETSQTFAGASRTAAQPFLPGYVKRLFPPAGRLEDNPIFLREMSYAYARRSALPTLLEIVLFFVIPSIMMLLALVYWGFTAMLLVFLIFAGLKTPVARLASVNRFSSFLIREWNEGRLEMLLATRLTHEEIAWGFIGCVAWRTAIRYFRLVFAASLALLSFPLARYYFEYAAADPAALLAYLIGVLAVAAQLLFLTLASIFYTAMNQIAYLGHSTGYRIGLVLTVVAVSTLAFFLSLLPGLYGGIIAMYLAGNWFNDLAIRIAAFFIGDAMWAIPASLILFVTSYRYFKKRIDRHFSRAVMRLGDGDYLSRGDSSFGRKSSSILGG